MPIGSFGEYANFFGGFVPDVQQAQKTAYDYNQKRGLGAALRESIDPKTGKPVEAKYYELINKYKIDQDPATEYFNRMAGIYKTGASAASDAAVMSGLGADPTKLVTQPSDADAQAGEMFGVKKTKPAVEPAGTSETSPTSTPEPTAAQAKPTEMDSRVVAEPGYTTTEPTPGQPTLIRPDLKAPVVLPAPAPAPEAPVAATNAPRSEMDLGSTRIIGTVPPAEPAPVAAAPAGGMFVTDFLRSIKSPTAGATTAAAGESGAGSTDASLFTWAPEDDGTNVYQQYKSALDSQLKAGGYTDASDYLRKTYDATLRENTPTSPNELQMLLGKEGIAKYGDQRQAYAAAMQIAKGKAEKAVLEARGKLADFAKQFGVNTVEQRKTELPEGMVLRDPAKRNEAAALITNRKTIEFAKEAVRAAGTDGSKLEMAAPQVIRTYATAMNPGQQLSEGNLAEVAASLYPEFGSNHDMLIKIAGAMMLSFKGDDSALKGILSKIQALSPTTLQARLSKLANEAEVLNERALSTMVTNVPARKTEAPSAPAAAPADTTKPAAALTAKDKEAIAAKAITGPKKAATSVRETAPAAAPKLGDTRKGPNGKTQYYTSKGWM